MTNMKKIVLLLLLITASVSIFAFDSEYAFADQDIIIIDFFYSATCPHCKKEKELFEDLKTRFSNFELREYEVMGSEENQQLLKDFYENYSVPQSEQGLVPATFIGDEYFVGFNDQVARSIEGLLDINQEVSEEKIITVPILGEVNLSEMSLPVLAITLGALDGFNPCAMWVLLFLITLLVNTHSKKRMYLIGGTFLLASGVVYFLILSAWLNLFLVISYANLTRILIGVFAIAIGIWQIRSFLSYKPGTCEVAESKGGFQEKLKKRMQKTAEKLVVSPLNFGIFAGIVLLAFGVNLVEFFCSAGLPAIFTRILTLNEVSTLNYYFYLLIYTFVFMLDDLIIFLLAIFAISKIGFTEKYNYWTTLVGGILILALGALLIFWPEILMFK